MSINRAELDIHTWQDLLRVDPGDPDAPGYLGVLLVQRKHFAEAIEPLKTALNLNHLAQVYEQQHRTKDAVHMYRLAIVTLERRLPAERQKAIREHIAVLDPNGYLRIRPGPTITLPSDELAQMRTVKLPRIVQGTSSAGFFLLFGPGPKVEDVDLVSGSDDLDKAEKTLAATEFQISFPWEAIRVSFVEPY